MDATERAMEMGSRQWLQNIFFKKIVFLEDDNGVIKDGTRDLCLVNLLMVMVLSKTGESQGRQLDIGGNAITSSIY